MWTCGNNTNGGTGLGVQEGNTITPTQISSLPKIKSIAAGWDNSLFLDVEDTLWICGSIYPDAELPRKVEEVNSFEAIETIAAGYYLALVAGTDKLFGCGVDSYDALPLQTTGLNKRAVAPKCTNTAFIQSSVFCHSLFLDCEGTVWGCGRNDLLGVSASQTKKSELIRISGLPPIGTHFSTTGSIPTKSARTNV